MGIEWLVTSNIKKVFAKNLKRLLGKTRPIEFAEKLGVSYDAVNAWLNAKRWPDSKQIDLILDKTGWSEKQLFTGEDQPIQSIIDKHNESDSPFRISLK